MAAEERWYFTKEQLVTTPSRKCGIDPDKELSYRQQAANFIQDMGQRLQVNQLCINTAIVYVHRFYMFHSFTRFHRNAISTCALFLAAKVEEQPRKLEHVIKVAHMCLHREAPPLDSKSEAYLEQSHELISNENIMLQTLGFDVAIDHPHTHVVKCCQLVRGGGSSLHQHHASKDLAQTSYFMATNSLHLTTMCLQYKPTVVACVCIHLACKWADWEIPQSSEGKDWFWYVDKTVTVELLEELTAEFLAILDRCPSRLKRKMMSSSVPMNDKIQDTAMVEKKLAAEFAAQANSRANLVPPGTSATPAKPDRHHERSSNPLKQLTSSSSKTTTLEHAESNAAVLDLVSSTIDKNGTPSTDRKDRGIKRENVIGNLTSSKAMMTSLVAAPSTPPAEPTSPKSIVSPPTIQKTLSLQDLGYSSLSQDNLSINTHTSSPPAVSTPKKAKLQQWGSSNAVNTTGSGTGSGRGLTPKEYREYKEQKKRERAEKKDRSQSNHPLTPQSIKTEVITPEKDLTKLNLSSSSSGGSCSNLTALSAARHMQPVVALTSLNISALNKVPSSKHGGLSSRHTTHLLKTPEKQKLIVDGGGSGGQKDDLRSTDDVTRHGIGTNHCGQSKEAAISEDPVPALVRPPILTPSPPLATGEESKPDILDERPSSISFSSSMEETVLEESPIPSSVKLQPPFFRTELHKKEREEARLHTSSSSSLLHTTPSSVSSSHGKPSSRRHEVTATKERLIKHHKSKTPVTPPTANKVHQVASLLPATPQTQSSIDNAISALMTSPQVPLPSIQTPSLPLHNFGTDITSLVPETIKTDIKSEPRTSSSSSTMHLTTNVGSVPVSLRPASENGAEILTQERIHQGATVTSASVVSRNVSLQSKDLVRPLEGKGNVVVKSSQPSLLPQPPMPPKLSRVEEAKHSLVMETPVTVKDKQPQVAMITQPTLPVKHEKREKHKHKDRDRERSKDKRSSSAVPVPTNKEPSPAPAIKLTIPKERLHLSTTEGLSGGSTTTSKGIAVEPSLKESGGGLKIKIPKGKISGSKSSKSSVSPMPPIVAPVAAPAPPPPPPTTTLSISSDGPPKEGGGLKIKITKDRLSSKGLYNLSVSGRDESKDRTIDRGDSRKRERVPSPVGTIQKQPLLPIPTGESSSGLIASDTDSKPPKAAKLSSRATRKSQSHANSPYDVPPSSNTRSSLKQESQPQQPRSESYNKPRAGRGGHKGGSKHRGRGGGVGGMGGPHPHFGGHQVTLNAGPYPYTQYFPYPHQPNYFNHPMSHHPPPPVHPHGPIPPPPSVHHGHPGEYPPPFYGQPPPPYRGPPPPITGGSSFQSQTNLMRRHIPPPLPSEPPPAIPPPPPE